MSFNTSTIRMVTIDGNPWYVAADVCRALSLDLAGGVHRHLSKLDTSETHKLPLDLRGGQSNTISESGLYKLVMRSNKPSSQTFPRLKHPRCCRICGVTKVVLPATRPQTRIENAEKIRESHRWFEARQLPPVPYSKRFRRLDFLPKLMPVGRIPHPTP